MFWPLFMCFAPYLGVGGGGGGLPRGPGHNLLMQFSSLGSSKMEISKTDLFDTLTIQNDQISYIKHVLAPLYVFFTLFGCRGGGGSPRAWGTTCLCSFPASAAEKWSFLSPLRGADRDRAVRAVEAPYGPMGACGGLWRPMGTYGDLWGPIGTYGDIWGPMGAFGDL